MIHNTMHAILAMGPSPSGGQQQTAPWWSNLVPLLLMVCVFYFIFIRPQQKKAKQHTALMQGIRPGDKVVTTSGIIGIVVSVKEKSLSIRSADTKLEILKSAISEITERSGSGEASESSS